MLSKEEIEKAKERISKSLEDVWFGTLYSQEENDEDEKTLLQYIKELEADNYELNNRLNDYIEERDKQNKVIDEMANKIYEEGIIWENKEKVKQYFEKKVEGK